MNLCEQAVNLVVHPSAAFLDLPALLITQLSTSPIDWDDSDLNPKNRIDSLDDLPNSRWRIDGCTGLGTQFYTVPLFLLDSATSRIDTFIPPQSQHSPKLRELLGLDHAFSWRDNRVTHLAISRHIVRALDYWSRRVPDFEETYKNLPFGSRIVFETLEKDVRKISIKFAPIYTLERQLKSVKTLHEFWDDSKPAKAWPGTIDISKLTLQRHLHDSISLVTVQEPQGPRQMILKALTSQPKYLYHELKVLLALPPHPNIISRPQHLVTKRCRFGNKIAVVGFTLEYHPQETTRDLIPFRLLHSRIYLEDQLKWSIQLVSALIHINKNGLFYPDLRLDNILMSNSGDLVMVDFEQRGCWCTFSAPEVNYLEYIHTLAKDENIPLSIKQEYQEKFARFAPGVRVPPEDYDNPGAYCVQWLPLSQDERESAQVFMLGRVLWCIFEGVSAPEVAIWQYCKYESLLQFPEYKATPKEIRDLIDSCTKSVKEGIAKVKRGVTRDGSRLVIVGGGGTESVEEVQTVAKTWWKKELKRAEDFLEQREKRRADGCTADFFGRPKLSEVFNSLKKFQVAMSGKAEVSVLDH
jgi:hypothetical protein